jgi:hypothetical protein
MPTNPLPSRAAKNRRQSQLGVDGLDVTHPRSIWLRATGSTSPSGTLVATADVLGTICFVVLMWLMFFYHPMIWLKPRQPLMGNRTIGHILGTKSVL